MTSGKKEIIAPKKETDSPPLAIPVDTDDISDLSPIEKRDWRKWLKNLDFVKYIISIMLFLYFVDIIISVAFPIGGFS